MISLVAIADIVEQPVTTSDNYALPKKEAQIPHASHTWLIWPGIPFDRATSEHERTFLIAF